MISLYSEINDLLWKEFERGEISKDNIRTLRFKRLSEISGLNFNTSNISTDYVKRLATKRYLLTGALEACELLHRYAKLYIITNGIYTVQLSRIKQSPIAQYISDIFVSEKIGFAKPNVAYFDYVLEQIKGANREDMLVVGDSLTSDIAGGIAAGLDVCWINPEGEKAPKDMDINYNITAISDLPELIIH